MSIPSQMVKEEVKILNKLSDEEIAKEYAKMSLSPYPMMIRVDALNIIMAERRFKVELVVQHKIVRL